MLLFMFLGRFGVGVGVKFSEVGGVRFRGVRF